MQVVSTDTVSQGGQTFKGTPAPVAPEPQSLSELVEQEIKSGRTKTKSEAVLARDDGGDDGEYAETADVSDDGDDGGDDGSAALSAETAEYSDVSDDGSAALDGHEDSAAGSKSKRPDSFSRTKASLVKSERALTAANVQVRQLQAEVRRLSEHRAAQAEPADVTEAVRHTVSKRMNLAADDPRVTEELARIAQDLLLEGLDPKSLDPRTGADVRRAREERLRTREQRQRDAQVEERFARLEREKNEAIQAGNAEKTRNTVNERLTRNAERLPFLGAQTDVDPTAAVIEMADAMINGGHVQLSTPQEALRLIDQCAVRLDAYYHEQAKALAARLPGVSGQRQQSSQNSQAQTQQVAPKKQAPRRRSGTGSGGGGRGAPSVSQTQDHEAEPESFSDFVAQQKVRYAALERKRQTRR